MREVSDEPTRLVERALRARRRDAYWRRVARLQELGNRAVFDAVRHLLDSADPVERRLGADVLSELGFRRSPPPFRDESIALLPLVEVEPDPGVLAAAVRALARLGARSALPVLAGLAGHPAVAVRLALAAELSWCAWQDGVERPDEAVTAVLIGLSADPVAEVRSWACFGLAQSRADGAEVRKAL